MSVQSIVKILAKYLVDITAAVGEAVCGRRCLQVRRNLLNKFKITRIKYNAKILFTTLIHTLDHDSAEFSPQGHI